MKSRPAKYRNRPTEFRGETFDSRREARRYQDLLLLQAAGEISNLRRQVKYELIPKTEYFRAGHYVADFVYTDNRTGKEVAEDSKGFRTPEYRWKKKMMYAVHGILIFES